MPMLELTMLGGLEWWSMDADAAVTNRKARHTSRSGLGPGGGEA